MTIPPAPYPELPIAKPRAPVDAAARVDGDAPRRIAPRSAAACSFALAAVRDAAAHDAFVLA